MWNRWRGLVVGGLGLLAAGIALGAQPPQPALPDAAITLTARGGGFRAGEKIGLVVVVRNEGSAPLAPVPVALMADGRRYAEWKLPGELAPGASAEWRTSYVGARGMHLLSVSADPFDDVAESSRSNNAAFLNVGLADARPPFPWLALLSGAVFFALGLGAGSLLRRPDLGRPRRKPVARPKR